MVLGTLFSLLEIGTNGSLRNGCNEPPYQCLCMNEDCLIRNINRAGASTGMPQLHQRWPRFVGYIEGLVGLKVSQRYHFSIRFK